MRFVIAACVAGFALVGIVAVARQPPRTADAQAVRDVVARYVAAREARDPAAVAALFTDDADQLVSSGEWRLGRDKVVEGSLASTERTGGKREIAIERVRFVSDDVAIADGRYTIAGLETGDRRMWSTFVMVKVAAGWKIAAIRNMLPAAPAAAATEK
jgi:uncharacterized protein (TIGR02246 family)